jgi:hypothetical protein
MVPMNYFAATILYVGGLERLWIKSFRYQSILNTYNALGGNKSQFQKKQKTFSEYTNGIPAAKI